LHNATRFSGATAIKILFFNGSDDNPDIRVLLCSPGEQRSSIIIVVIAAAVVVVIVVMIIPGVRP